MREKLISFTPSWKLKNKKRKKKSPNQPIYQFWACFMEKKKKDLSHENSSFVQNRGTMNRNFQPTQRKSDLC